MMAIQRKLMTAGEFERIVNLPENADKRFEFIDGEMFEVPSNPYSSEIASLLNRFVGNFVYPQRLGHVTGEQGGYIVAGARLAPDVAYISKARQPQLVCEGYNPNPPELTIEVISPTDKPEELERKLAKYAAAKVLVWVVYPERREVEVFAPGQPKRVVGIDGTLDGGDVLPGFKLALREIFAN
jgi:Uma2 family endonuclease